MPNCKLSWMYLYLSCVYRGMYLCFYECIVAVPVVCTCGTMCVLLVLF
jgi:hypothetical protein